MAGTKGKSGIFKRTPEHRRNLGLAHVGKKYPWSPERRAAFVARSGANHHRWTGGHLSTMKRWALVRDKNTCQKCGLHDEEILVVDHIKPKSIYPELEKVMENLMTLCPNCHARKTIKDAAEIARIKRARIKI